MTADAPQNPKRRPVRSRLKATAFRYLPGFITCRDFDAFVIDYLDGSLSDRQRVVFERHLRLCPPCNRFLDHYRTTVDVVKAAGPATSCDVLGDPPKDLVQAVLRSRRAG